MRPSLTSESLWQMPHACTLIRTDPGTGSGIGRSTISKGPFGRETCTTRIVAMVPPVVFRHPRLTGRFVAPAAAERVAQPPRGQGRLYAAPGQSAPAVRCRDWFNDQNSPDPTRVED